MPRLSPHLGNKTMPRPIRVVTLTAGAALLLLSMIPLSIFWPKIVALDWPFFKVLALVSIPLAYALIVTYTGRTVCYWLAVVLLKAETFQWLVIECCGRFIATYKEMYPVRERQVRIAVGRNNKIESYEDYLGSMPQYAEDMKTLIVEMDRVEAAVRGEHE